MKCRTSLCEAMVVLSLYKKTQIGYTHMMLMLMKLEQVPTFLLRHNDAHVHMPNVSMQNLSHGVRNLICILNLQTFCLTRC